MKTPDEIKKGLECCHITDCGNCPFMTENIECREIFADAISYIQQLEAKVPKWISVEERLPEVDEWALTYYGNSYGCICVLQWTGRGWVDEYRNEETKELITHWLPIPETPEV